MRARTYTRTLFKYEMESLSPF